MVFICLLKTNITVIKSFIIMHRTIPKRIFEKRIVNRHEITPEKFILVCPCFSIFLPYVKSRFKEYIWLKHVSIFLNFQVNFFIDLTDF